MRAEELLQRALDTLRQRGEGYDDGRERSGKLIAEKFATMTRIKLRESEIYALLQAVKLARLDRNPGHEDSLVDYVAYVALEIEAETESAQTKTQTK